MKRTNKMASAAMKLAHKIKNQFLTFAAALKSAWTMVKKPSKVTTRTMLDDYMSKQSDNNQRVYKNIIAKFDSRNNTPLPVITGSKSQVEFAEKVRKNLLSELDTYITNCVDYRALFGAMKVRNSLASKSSAAELIDLRDRSVYQLVAKNSIK